MSIYMRLGRGLQRKLNDTLDRIVHDISWDAHEVDTEEERLQVQMRALTIIEMDLLTPVVDAIKRIASATGLDEVKMATGEVIEEMYDAREESHRLRGKLYEELAEVIVRSDDLDPDECPF